ncbi:MAG: VPLPA-CTERM sorting domain-containing protein [Gammaproteobacteria bacterium]|nr:VPLPA-CTERM sorting domain-containing protein [Gammaproteobacteria bacterium]
MYPIVYFSFSIRHVISTACLLSALLVCTSSVAATAVFLNEIHYDNEGGDTNEGVEIAGPSGLDLSDWQLLLYNGSRGNIYGTHELSGTLPEMTEGFGLLAFATPGLQNGPDGFALVNDLNEVVQFLSYEASFTATEGAASGLSSELIGAEESSSTSLSYSLQLTGSGRFYGDFQWNTPQMHSFDSINPGQSITPSAVPLPAALPLFLSGIIGFSALARRRNI